MKIVMPGASLPSAARRASRVGRDELVEIAAGAPSTRSSTRDGVGDLEEADAAVEERGHGDLVGRVVGARERASALTCLPRQPQQREGLEVGGLEAQLEPGGEIERARAGRRRAPG